MDPNCSIAPQVECLGKCCRATANVHRVFSACCYRAFRFAISESRVGGIHSSTEAQRLQSPFLDSYFRNAFQKALNKTANLR